MKRLRMLWWLLTKKDVAMIVRGHCGKTDYSYETTTSPNDAVTLSARLCQFCYSALHHKEMFLDNIFKIYIPEE